jgi:hypothetical protein
MLRREHDAVAGRNCAEGGFLADSEHVKITAVVRTSDPGVGNGIEFTGMPEDTKERMQAYLDAIDPQMGISGPKTG